MSSGTIAQRVLGIKAEYVSYHYPDREHRRKKLGKPYLDKAVSKDNLFSVGEVFNHYGIVFFLMYGTLLGAVRENNFIDHDIDTEIGIFEEDKEKLINALKTLLSVGFDLIRANYPDDVVTIMRSDEIIDIGIFRCEKDRNGVDYRVYQHNREYFLSPNRLIPFNFLGRDFLIPLDPEKYLVQWYGEDWRVPKMNASAWPYNYPDWKKKLHRVPSIISLYKWLKNR